MILTLCSSTLVLFIRECMSVGPFQILKIHKCLPTYSPLPHSPTLNQKLEGHRLLQNREVILAGASIVESLLPIPVTPGL